MGCKALPRVARRAGRALLAAVVAVGTLAPPGATMYESQTCGRCHDGRTAFLVEETCHAVEGAER
jgi:hypothetical protein